MSHGEEPHYLGGQEEVLMRPIPNFEVALDEDLVHGNERPAKKKKKKTKKKLKQSYTVDQ